MAITRQSRDFPTIDTGMQLKDAGLVAASAAATVSSSAKVIDLGAGRFDGRVMIDASAIEVDSGNELYTIVLQGSNSSSFASGVFGLASIRLGHSSTTLESTSTATCRREMPFCNEVNGTVYRYIRIYTVVAGTIATGINFVAYVGQR